MKNLTAKYFTIIVKTTPIMVVSALGGFSTVIKLSFRKRAATFVEFSVSGENKVKVKVE